MEPIRPPRRNAPAHRSGTRELLPYVAAILALMLLAVGASRLHENGWRITISDSANDSDIAAESAKVIYACYDGQTGRLLYEQSEPCPSAAPDTARTARMAPTYEAATPSTRPQQAPAPAYRPNPNQALLDAADVRYQREVQSAQQAGYEQERQRDSARGFSAQVAAGQTQQCRWICDSLARLRTEMRNPYNAHQSVHFHERQNKLFKAMNDSDCRACMN